MVAILQHLSERIAATISGKGRLTFAIDDEAALHGCIALYGSIGLIVGLRPDGSLWQFDADVDLPLSPLPRDQQLAAVVLGVRRYAWLAELLPERATEALDCSICESRGVLASTETLGVYRSGSDKGASGIICPHCGGLGWLQM